MIATLSISLPVKGRGGELFVRHRDREVRMYMGADEPSELAFAAFYADCTHEIQPVVEGHRLSLCSTFVFARTIRYTAGSAGLHGTD